jgi:hypothetical protein
LNDGGSKEIKERNGGGAEEVVAGKGRNKGKIDRNIGIERERERERLKTRRTTKIQKPYNMLVEHEHVIWLSSIDVPVILYIETVHVCFNVRRIHIFPSPNSSIFFFFFYFFFDLKRKYGLTTFVLILIINMLNYHYLMKKFFFFTCPHKWGKGDSN